MTGNTERKLNILGWEITNDCNLHCPHCYNPVKHSNKSELSTEQCLTIIDSAAELGTKMIGWTGGEPLLRSDLEQLIQYAAEKHGIKSCVTTNGALLDKSRGHSLKAAGLDYIQISLDGTTAERSWRIRRTTNEEFNNIIDAIKICQENGIDVYLAMLLGNENLDDGFAMIDLAKQKKVLGIRFCGFTPEGRASNNKIKKRFEFGDNLKRLHDFILTAHQDESIQAVFDPGFGPVPPDYYFHECVAGIETCYIKANGDVFPCTAMLYDRFIVGNIFERTLESIWNDPAMTSMSCFPDGDINGICSECENLDNCHGACRSLTYAHTGSFNESFPNCLFQIQKYLNILSNN